MSQSFTHLQSATRDGVLDGAGASQTAVRRLVASGQPPPELAILVQKIRDHAYKVTDSDIDALRARYSEDELFELIIAAAVGAAEHRLKAAVAAVESA
jgi:hypothetical protein